MKLFTLSKQHFESRDLKLVLLIPSVVYNVPRTGREVDFCTIGSEVVTLGPTLMAQKSTL